MVRSRALYFDGHELRLIDDHVVERGGEALIRVGLAGICGTDLQILRGYASFRGVPGHEFVGRVVESDRSDLVGARVVGEINAACGRCDMCAVGLRRHCRNRTVLGIKGRDGVFAEYVRLPVENLHRVPDSVEDERAVFTEPLAAAFEILEQVHVDPSWRTCVVGDGRLANLIAQVLRDRVWKLKVIGRHQRKIGLLRELGIEAVEGVEPGDESSYDLVVEATGRAEGLSLALRLVRPRGHLVLKSTIASEYRIDLAKVVVDELHVVGSRCGPFRPALSALSSGSIDVRRLVDGVYGLEEFRDAFAAASSRGTLKVLLRP
ncbi:MAG: alcohol dehydrogenase catalytic domain-containing protein [Thaumarchaeota archaeon]|nr:alcohol dehydrogenase catalytic domain-containing protein [Candidatus Calditenuaceae archaeon]MDW8042130.1 alcohol dehydrogenase catalytic domain-containing protein [Nitrososphaerota archaeon]